MNPQQAMTGAVGIAKSVLGIQRLPLEQVQERLAICRACPQVKNCPGTKHRVCACNVCGCQLKHKARLRDESCPLDKW